jgi:O-acetyl-ADP-ribose deacetylase (regulator of RNase III)
MVGIKVKVAAGTMVEQQVDMLVNSANTFLIMGSGTAEQIREAGGCITGGKPFEEYWRVVGKAKGELKTVLDYIHSKRQIPSIVQKECLEYLILKNDSRELNLGDAILTSSGNLSKVPGMAKHVAHAVGMTYDWKVQPNPPIIPATKESVRNALERSFEIANSLECRSVAVPVMCTRKGGLSMEESTEATLKALQTINCSDSKVKEITIVLYNDEMEKDIEGFRNAYRC